jgi:16S rRNA (adenine1518-N6/adenine1519-N6)-dimethyltransferase
VDVHQVLKKYNIVPNALKDQFFIANEKIIQEMVSYAELQASDVVLEIGAGSGLLTREIAKKAGKVITFEVDSRFKPLISELPKNVELHLEDAREYVRQHGKWLKKKEYNKIVSNLPYSFIEPFLHFLTFLDYEKVILMIPLKMVETINKNPVFSSFFTLDVKRTVSKETFYPIPRTHSAIIDLIHIPNTIKEHNLDFFLRQYIYQHEDQKVKNSLKEGIIAYAKLTTGESYAQNQARRLILESGISPDLLEKTPNNREIYFQISEKLKNLPVS